MPTRTDKAMYYLNMENIDNYHKFGTWQNKEEINARRRARFAEMKKEGMLMAIACVLEIELLNL